MKDTLLPLKRHEMNLGQNRMIHLKPEPTNRAEEIFQEACTVENMEAKFGRKLSSDANRIRNFVLTQSPLLGRIPYIHEIKKEFERLKKGRVDAILSELDKVDAIHLDDDNKNIDAAYPFSGSETFHQVHLKKEGFKTVYAMCAIDALGISFMFDCDVSIESRCHHCEECIEIGIRDNVIFLLNPKDTLVWCDMEYSCCAATSLCKNTNFFSSEKHFEEWQREKQRRKGSLLAIQEAFYLGKLFFENRLE